MSKSSVFIMKTNGTYQKIGDIVESGSDSNSKSDSKNKVIIDPSIAVNTINVFNRKILEFIKDDNGYLPECMKYVESGDIRGIILHIMRWRRCTGYLVFQQSNQGNRHLFYIHDKIKHSARCFGTSMEHVEMSLVKEAFKNKIPILLKKIEKYRKYISFIENTNNVTNTANNNENDDNGVIFGI